MGDKKIKLFLFTGFLGAGKTTLVKNLLEGLEDKKVGLIVNEFGKIGVDGQVVQKEGMEVVEINNGSIFCTCLEGSFIEKVVGFSKLPIEYLFVEASGLSDPSNMESILNQVQRITGAAFSFEGSFCVVDAKNFMKLHQSLNTFDRQLNYSNMIIINKIDLVEQETIDKIGGLINTINPMAGVIKTTYCQVDEDIFTKNEKVFGFPAFKVSNNCPSSRPEIVVLSTQEKASKDSVTAFARVMAQHTFRVKGFVQLEEGMYHLDCVEEQIDMRPTHLSRETTEIVLISKEEQGLMEKTQSVWDDLVGISSKIESE